MIKKLLFTIIIFLLSLIHCEATEISFTADFSDKFYTYNNGVIFNHYTKDELKTLERVCLLFKKMDALIRGDENLMEIKKIYEDIANDKEFVEEYTKDELERLTFAEKSVNESLLERNIEIAKSMLSDGMDIKVVSKHTGLSISELENLSLD